MPLEFNPTQWHLEQAKRFRTSAAEWKETAHAQLDHNHIIFSLQQANRNELWAKEEEARARNLTARN